MAKRLEKYLLRKAFDSQGLLPDEALWRRKWLFLMGSVRRINPGIILFKRLLIKNQDDEFIRERKIYKHCMPQLKESYYYRKIFEQYFGKNEQLIPHFWMPKWVKTNDPSARELTGYQE
ncbi:MAG: hypothetical protein CM1200mP10_23190 [Candidatus Neomarinimicrobiota bacterium]|nr:MAG: hypothetical protein CM1200mP10_23190 [Candidatus Neomarinimicrobiota bacterium]